METPLRLNAPVYGWLLAITTIVSLAVIAHHPMADLHDRSRGLENVVALAGPAQWVHGSAIAFVLMFAVGFSGVAWRLGISHPLVMTGWLSYVCGTIVMMAAALIDGFIIPDIAGRLAAERQAAYDLITFCGVMIQAFAKLAFALQALGAVALGGAFMHRPGAQRWMGLFAIAVGGLSGAFILTMQMGFDVERLLIYMAAQSIWQLVAAVWMIRTSSSQTG